MKHWVPDIIASLLVLLFVYTAVSKLMDYETFRNQLNHTSFISSIPGLAILLPVTELAVAGLLIFRETQLPGFYISAILLSAFTIYIAAILLFAPHLPCSCGGVIKQLTWKQHLVFNVFFIALSFIGIVWYRKRKEEQANTTNDFDKNIGASHR